MHLRLYRLASPTLLTSAKRFNRPCPAGMLAGLLLAALCLPAAALGTTGKLMAALPAAPAPPSRQASSALGIDQVRSLPASASIGLPAQPPAAASQLQTPAQPASKSPARQSLQSARVQPGTAPKPAKPLPTSANCDAASSGAECMRPGPAAADWRKDLGVEVDAVTGAILIPGVTLNPPPRP